MTIADTSPLNYLLLIDEVHLLQKLFKGIIIPPTVAQELSHPRAPLQVRSWISSPPDWIVIRRFGGVAHPNIMPLHKGERDAIQLALEQEGGTVLLDDHRAREVAQQLHLNTLGTLGILKRGARLGYTDLSATLDRLSSTNFRVSSTLLRAVRYRQQP